MADATATVRWRPLLHRVFEHLGVFLANAEAAENTRGVEHCRGVGMSRRQGGMGYREGTTPEKERARDEI